MCGPFLAATIDMVASALPADRYVTARDLEGTLPVDLARGSIRAILLQLVREGRAAVAGDVTQRRYRLNGERP